MGRRSGVELLAITVVDGPTERRFWKKVQRGTGCWLWTASTNDRGYGRFRLGDDVNPACGEALAHRFSYALHHGTVPRGLEVLHSCDVPRCVAPNHLSLGTHRDNMRDAAQKGRTNRVASRRGETHGRSKLTNQQALDIARRYRAAQADQYELAREYGVKQSTIWAIINGRCWKHVEGLREFLETATDRTARLRAGDDSRIGRCKLTPSQLDELRRRAALGQSRRSLGRAFGVHGCTVKRLVSKPPDTKQLVTAALAGEFPVGPG